MSKEQIYDEKISPMMTEIIKLCKENKIPVFCTFGLDENPDAEEDEFIDGEPPTLWCSTSLPVSEKKRDNTNINKLYKVQYKGYDVVPNFMAFTITSEK